MLLSGADIIVKVLIEQGTEVVFGYPGGQIIDVYDSLYRASGELTHVLTAHEQGAAHAADGYARTTGRPGVVLATSGPGATNLVTGIATAHLDSVPLIAICGNVATSQIGTDSFQEIDITGITLPITKHNYFVGAACDLAPTMREAFQLAVSGRPGPVLIDVPKDVQEALCEYEPAPAVVRATAQPAKRVRIQEAAELINSSKRPYIYFGGGIVASDACDEMLQLAERIDAPLGASLMGLAALPSEHPRFLGMQGMHGHAAATRALVNADVIIALGVRFNDRATGNRAKFAKVAKLVQIDADGSELSKTVMADIGLRGDIKATLQELLELVVPSTKPDWQAEIARLREDERAVGAGADGGAAAGAGEDAGAGAGAQHLDAHLSPHAVMRALNAQLAPTTPVCTDVGQHQMWVAQDLIIKTPRRFVTSGGLGTMGFGLGAAIGACYGTGERAVLVTGDGGFGMDLIELATAVTYQLPIVVLIMNNGVLGMVRQWQRFFFEGRYSSTTLGRQTDFVAVARAFGAAGEAVDSLPALEAALARAFAAPGPYVIDCAIDKDELVLPMLPPGGSVDDLIEKVGD